MTRAQTRVKHAMEILDEAARTDETLHESARDTEHFAHSMQSIETAVRCSAHGRRMSSRRDIQGAVDAFVKSGQVERVEVAGMGGRMALFVWKGV